MASVRAASSARTFGWRRCVARDCPTTAHARRSDTGSCERTWSTHARLREGLKVPNKQPKRGRLWLNDGSCIRLRPERPNHVWSYDFMQDRTEDGRRFRMLTVIEEFTRRLAVVVARKFRSDDVLHYLTDLLGTHGTMEHIRSGAFLWTISRLVFALYGEMTEPNAEVWSSQLKGTS